jgi:hypothetical protein
MIPAKNVFTSIMSSQIFTLICYAIATNGIATQSVSYATQISGLVHYKVSGYCEFNGNLMFSISDLRTGGSRWLSRAQVYNDLQLLEFDTHQQAFKAIYRGQEVYLHLKKTNDATVVLPQSPPLQEETLSPSRIKQLVSELETKLIAGLPEESHKLHTAMKTSIQNRIAAYESSMIAKQMRQAEGNGHEHETFSGKQVKPMIGSLRQENRINSRVWASDHIEIHGEPSL